MPTYESLKHTSWECKCHEAFISEYRHKTRFARVPRELGTVFRSLAGQQARRACQKLVICISPLL